MDRGFVIKNNDLLFEIYFSATSTHDDRYYSTQVVHSAMLPSMGKLHLALTQRGRYPFRNVQRQFRYLPQLCP